jgi:hypothetical protein
MWASSSRVASLSILISSRVHRGPGPGWPFKPEAECRIEQKEKAIPHHPSQIAQSDNIKANTEAFDDDALAQEQVSRAEFAP